MISERAEKTSKDNSKKKALTRSTYDNSSSTKYSTETISDFLTNNQKGEQTDNQNEHLLKKIDFKVEAIADKHTESNQNNGNNNEIPQENEGFHGENCLENAKIDLIDINNPKISVNEEVKEMNIDDVFLVLVDKVKKKRMLYLGKLLICISITL